MDIPAKLAIPMRVIASNVAISCQLDAHVPDQERSPTNWCRVSPNPNAA